MKSSLMLRRRLVPRDVIRFGFPVVFLLTFGLLVFSITKTSEAASLENFRAGNIISDYVMSNSSSMTAEEISAFLKKKGNCNNTSVEMASWYPNLHYHIENGHFVCLADELFAETGTNFGDLLTEEERKTAKTAAEIISEVSKEYKINPQVLIVLLQKEQGLITDSWPNSVQYRSATGYGCPDTAACSEKYYGFKNQLKNAAALFRTVLDGGWTNYPLGENYIYYNPNRDCGGSVVKIENLATSSLYRYTPYQPNSAALAAGYGTATCGAYGNRNFYLYFMDYFGDPTYVPADASSTSTSTSTSTTAPTTSAPAPTQSPSSSTPTDSSSSDSSASSSSTSSQTPAPDDSASGIIKNGQYLIVSPLGTALDIDRAATADRSKVWMYQKNGTAAQIFELSYNATGDYYVFKNPNSGKVLDVPDNSKSNGALVKINTWNDSCSQKWQIIDGGSGNYEIVSTCSGKALDIDRANPNLGAKLQIYEHNSTLAQKWRFEEVAN